MYVRFCVEELAVFYKEKTSLYLQADTKQVYLRKENTEGVVPKMELKRNILDIEGLKVGQAENPEAKTGVTVVIAEKGAVCGVDVRGAAPGTRETDLLNPINAMEKVQAVVLSGGSAFGLEAASGIMDYLEEKDIGFDVGITKVPIVPSAVLYDLSLIHI